jgi:uncharacterized protein
MWCAAMTDASPLLNLTSYLRVGPPLELKADDGAEAGTIAGLASLFGEVDSHGDRIGASAFRRSLDEHKSLGTMPALLWSHNPAEPAGRWIEAREDARGLYVRGQLNLETDVGRRAYSHVKAGDCRGLSIGFGLYEKGWTRNPDGTRTLHAIDLREVSIVAMPAQRTAGIFAVKQAFSTKAELEEILRQSLPGRAVQKLLRGGWLALSGTDDNEPDPDQLARLDEHIARVTAALRRL